MNADAASEGVLAVSGRNRRRAAAGACDLEISQVDEVSINAAIGEGDFQGAGFQITTVDRQAVHGLNRAHPCVHRFNDADK